MRLIAIGGDLRMNALVRSAERAGMACTCVRALEELVSAKVDVDVAVLPWPKAFACGLVTGTDIRKEELIARLPRCGLLFGGGIQAQEFPQAARVLDPSGDETLLLENAKLTAEAAIAALLGGKNVPLLGKTCLITGFGRIAQALTKRLTAMEMFVIVCVRSERQMQLAHNMGAHPVPLSRLSSASLQADVLINTVPARIFSGEMLKQMKPGMRCIELASPPYGADPEQAAKLGVSMEIMGGLPGKYAPERAGEALFGVLVRALDGENAEGGTL